MLFLKWSSFLMWFLLLSPLLVSCFVIQDANQREELNKRFQAAVWAAYKREHSVAEDEERDEQVPPAAEAPAVEKKQCNGMDNFLKRHRDAYAPVADSATVPTNAKFTKRQEIAAACRQYQAANAELDAVEDPVGWWANVGRHRYPDLYPAVLGLLRFSSGNALLERLFSYAAIVTRDRRRSTNDLRRLLMLRTNGFLLGMQGYLTPWK